ncbi:hypothetical protein C8J56DRAFT_935005 [Mycena floridula]|nr:hypothetical protein C8J56DRAFT_935005 [Mycena floridula]
MLRCNRLKTSRPPTAMTSIRSILFLVSWGIKQNRYHGPCSPSRRSFSSHTRTDRTSWLTYTNTAGLHFKSGQAPFRLVRHIFARLPVILEANLKFLAKRTREDDSLPAHNNQALKAPCLNKPLHSPLSLLSSTMATQPSGEPTQQHWDDTLTSLLNLSSTTMQRKSDLETRVNELELELSIWKQAHAVAVEMAERDMRAHNVHIANLNRQISALDLRYGDHKNSPLILCVINGDQALFKPEYLAQGEQGGAEAAQHLTKVIAEHLSTEDVHIFGRLSFWITIYLNKRDYLKWLVAEDICNADQFNAFLAGFSRASPRFLMIDCFNQGDIDSKIQEYLQVYTPFTQTVRIFFAGCSWNSEYASTFNSLCKYQLLGKLVMLHGTSDISSAEPSGYALRHLKVPNLFMEPGDRLTSRAVKKLARLSVGLFSTTITTNGGLISPQSPPRPTRALDPTLPLHKQNPPPCNEYYLMTCSKGAGACKYAHDYALSAPELALLASNAKKAPCNWLKNGVVCPHGDQCCWGHVCPNGSKCFHLSKGKCWFKGEGMHPPPLSPSTPPNS